MPTKDKNKGKREKGWGQGKSDNTKKNELRNRLVFVSVGTRNLDTRLSLQTKFYLITLDS